MAKKIQSPVFEQVMKVYEAALVLDADMPADATERLIDFLKDDAAPNGKKITAALFPSSETKNES